MWKILVVTGLVTWMCLLPAAFAAEEKPKGETAGLTRACLLPPVPGKNPRNSEGAFLQLKDGRVLFIYSHFTGGGSDSATSHLAARFSRDGGKSWTDRDEIIVANEGKQNTMSVSLVRLQSGEIALFYLRRNAWDDLRAFMRISTDEAKTWSEAKSCIPEGGYFVVNNDRVIQLKSGRLVIPAARHNVPGGKWTSCGIALCYLSDDHGKTWHKGRTELEGPPGSRTGLQEPGVVELKDGKLLMLCRTDQGSQFRSYSEDGGDTWTPAQPTDIKSPVSPASIKRIPRTGDLLLVWNDHGRVDPKLRGKRTPFTAAISRDEGKTWEKRKTLEDDPAGWYCYTAMEFVANHVLLGHCAGNSRIGGLNQTQITLIDIDWLYR